jgi:hypothetical protein
VLILDSFHEREAGMKEPSKSEMWIKSSSLILMLESLDVCTVLSRDETTWKIKRKWEDNIKMAFIETYGIILFSASHCIV